MASPTTSCQCALTLWGTTPGPWGSCRVPEHGDNRSQHVLPNRVTQIKPNPGTTINIQGLEVWKAFAPNSENNSPQHKETSLDCMTLEQRRKCRFDEEWDCM